MIAVAAIDLVALQNRPEGFIVSVPPRSQGYSTRKSFVAGGAVRRGGAVLCSRDTGSHELEARL